MHLHVATNVNSQNILSLKTFKLLLIIKRARTDAKALIDILTTRSSKEKN